MYLFYYFFAQESGSNTTVRGENSHTTITENVEKNTSATSTPEKERKISSDREKGAILLQETAGNDSGTEEKLIDQVVEAEGGKAKDGNHSDPETGELKESLLLSIKEPSMDVTDNRKISFGEVLSETESSAEVWACTLSCIQVYIVAFII